MTHEDYMALALQEAKKGAGRVNPNPMVGAIVVKDEKILTTGYHQRYGGYHAERMALTEYNGDVTGATMYVTLEPCCHTGKTPPCTDIILERGISRVIVGSLDPNPKVDGGGIRVLQENGVEVITGVLKDVCDAFYQPFFHFITTKTPYVFMKYAMTADGKIATHTGASQWVSNEKSRAQTHELRNQMAGIMVGIGTVLADNPSLTCRMDGGVNPIRIVCDTHLRIPNDSQLVQTAGDVSTIIATAHSDCNKIKGLEKFGCTIIQVPATDSGIDLKALMIELGKRNIDSILLEGGAALNDSALRAGIVQGIRTYLAPKIFGGAEAKTPVGGIGVDFPDQAIQLKRKNIEFLDDDIVINWEVKKRCSQE